MELQITPDKAIRSLLSTAGSNCRIFEFILAFMEYYNPIDMRGIYVIQVPFTDERSALAGVRISLVLICIYAERELRKNHVK